MKFLLVAINAKYIHSNPAVFSLKEYAVEYATKFFATENNLVEIAEYTINQYTEKIMQDIYARTPDAIGFSCYIWNIEYVLEIIMNIKKVLPNVQIWLGGPEVSYNAEEIIAKYDSVTGIMRGEGERIFANLLDAMEGAEKTIADESTNVCLSRRKDFYFEEQPIDIFANVKGITYKKNIFELCKDGDPYKTVIASNLDEEPIVMSTIPFVYRNLEEFENRIIYYESSRGCPFSCSYCLSSIDKHLRFRDIKLVKQELQFFIDNKVAQVKFVDRTFNCKKEHSLAIWRYINEHDNGITNFHFEIAADILNEEELEVIKEMRPGLIQLEIGVQSTNENTITLIDRKMDFEHVSSIVNKLKSYKNAHLHLDLIVGLPQENIESFERSFNMVYGLKPEQLQLGFLKVLYGSKMKLQVAENDITYTSKPPYEVLSTKWISYDDIIRLKKVEEVLEIYYNSGQFGYSIVELEKYFESAFEMFDKLGQFYFDNAPNGEKHSRVQRYEILISFAGIIKMDERQRELFVELLTYDFYLRDNVKNRPAFAQNIEGYKKEINAIYIEEEENRQLLEGYEEFNSKQLAKMTHMEVFDIDINLYAEKELEQKGTFFMLFDYKNRNPLTNGARTIVRRKQ